MNNKRIRFNETYYDETELKNIKSYLNGSGNYNDDVQRHLMDRTGAGAVLLTSGATSAMDLFFAGAGLKKGSEVIMPSFTFPSAANVVLRAGLKPVFADIDEGTLVLDVDCVEDKINDKTAMIMPIHYGGVSMDMDRLAGIAKKNNLVIFEDSALSYLGYYKNKHLGTIGSAGVLSFHSTKNISGDGGGALLLKDSNNLGLYEELLANGTDKPAFSRGEVAEYTWQRTGAGSAMSGLTAALLFPQLEKEEVIMRRRQKVWDTYFKKMTAMGIGEFARLPVVPNYNKNNAHVFYLVFSSEAIREKVRMELSKHGIDAYIHYKPLHLSRMGSRLGYKYTDLPLTRSVAERMLRLPLHPGITTDDAVYISEEIISAVKNA